MDWICEKCKNFVKTEFCFYDNSKALCFYKYDCIVNKNIDYGSYRYGTSRQFYEISITQCNKYEEIK